MKSVTMNMSSKVSIDAGVMSAIRRAEGFKAEFGDSYVAIEHLLLALAEGDQATKATLRAAGVDAAWREWEGGYHAFVIFPFGDAPGAWEYVRERLRSTV